MPVNYNKVWRTMNDLEQIISKVVSAREMIDVANESVSTNDLDRAEKLTMAAYEFLGYFIEEFDAKFKDAWQATVGDLRDGDVVKTYSCDRDDQSPECQKAWNDFWVDLEQNKTNKWIVQVEFDLASGEYYLPIPDDLMKTVGWSEGDELEWQDNKDGTFTVRKVTKPLEMDEC